MTRACQSQPAVSQSQESGHSGGAPCARGSLGGSLGGSLDKTSPHRQRQASGAGGWLPLAPFSLDSFWKLEDRDKRSIPRVSWCLSPSCVRRACRQRRLDQIRRFSIFDFDDRQGRRSQVVADGGVLGGRLRCDTGLLVTGARPVRVRRSMDRARLCGEIAIRSTQPTNAIATR